MDFIQTDRYRESLYTDIGQTLLVVQNKNLKQINIFYLKLSWAIFIMDFVYSYHTPNTLLRIAVCSAQDTLLGKISMYEAGHTYKGSRIQARKCSYSE